MATTLNPVTRIMNLLKLEREEITNIYFYAVMKGLIQLSLPLGIQAIIGFVLGASMRATLLVLIILVVTGVLAAGLMKVNQMKIIEKIQQKLFVRYSFAIAEHIPKLDLKKADSYYLPELVNRFFDIPVLQKSLSKILLDVPTASIQIFSGLILLCFYHSSFILFGFILVVLLWFILRFTGNRGLQTNNEESTHKYRVAAWLEEMARIIKSVKLAKTNDLHISKTDEYVTAYLDARNRHFRILLLQYNVLVIFKTVITAAMLVVGTMLLINQQLNIGQFIAAEIIILMVLNSVEKLIMTLSSVYDTLTAVEKISNITDKPTEIENNVKLPETNNGISIEMKDLSFSFDDEATILHNISLNINAGEKVCIRGKGNSGKSTLLQVMAGAYTGFHGSFLLNNVAVGNLDLSSLRAQTGLLLNKQDIFYGTLWENIALGNPDIKMESVTGLAAKTGLATFINSLKNGYNTLLDTNGNRLPRNVVHKILLIRALINKPGLLLLEEPWLNFEDDNRYQVMQLLTSITNTTMVVVTNDEEFASLCDKVITLDEGTIQDIEIKTKKS